jgi:hypothetical protein
MPDGDNAPVGPGRPGVMSTPGGAQPSEPHGESAGKEPVSVRKSDKSQPQLDSQIPSAFAAGEMEIKGAAPSRRQRVVAAAGTARDRTIGQLVALLVPLIRATRYPLLAVVLVAAVPACAVIVIALLRPGIDDPFWLVLAAAGLVVAGWLGLRRRQLLAVAQDPDALAAALSSMVSGRDMWAQVVDNVSAGRVGKAVAKRSRPLRVLNGMWRGVQLTGVLTQLTERPELLPLMPGRLRGIWFLIVAALITGVVLGVAVLLVSLLYLLGA